MEKKNNIFWHYIIVVVLLLVTGVLMFLSSNSNVVYDLKVVDKISLESSGKQEFILATLNFENKGVLPTKIYFQDFKVCYNFEGGYQDELSSWVTGNSDKEYSSFGSRRNYVELSSNEKKELFLKGKFYFDRYKEDREEDSLKNAIKEGKLNLYLFDLTKIRNGNSYYYRSCSKLNKDEAFEIIGVSFK